MEFSVDSKIKDLLANEAAIAVIQKHVPEFDTKSLNMAKGMSLRAVSRFPQAKMVAKVLDQIDSDLKKLQSPASILPVDATVVPPARNVTTMVGKEEFYDRKDAAKWAHPALAAGWDMGADIFVVDGSCNPDEVIHGSDTPGSRPGCGKKENQEDEGERNKEGQPQITEDKGGFNL